MKPLARHFGACVTSSLGCRVAKINIDATGVGGSRVSFIIPTCPMAVKETSTLHPHILELISQLFCDFTADPEIAHQLESGIRGQFVAVQQGSRTCIGNSVEPEV